MLSLFFVALSAYTTRGERKVDFIKSNNQATLSKLETLRKKDLLKITKSAQINSINNLKTSNAKKWCYVKFNHSLNHENYLDLQNEGIEINLNNKIQNGIYKLFLSDDSLLKLISKYDVELSPLLPSQKLLTSDSIPLNEASRVCISTDSSFSRNHEMFRSPRSALETATKREKIFYKFKVKQLRNKNKDLHMNVTKISDNYFSVESNEIQETVEYFSIFDEISDIIPCSLPKTKNRFHAGRIQGSPVPESHDGRYMNRRLFTEAGINGTGEVVYIVDTGLDHRSIFFYDPNRQVIFDQANPSHRKIVYYSSKGGDATDSNGHGTHVSGTCAGHIVNRSHPYSNYDGQASGAKIAFLDQSVDGDIIVTPQPSLIDYIVQQTGAVVGSHSYGLDTEVEQNYRANWEAYEFTRPKILNIMAAGNEGPNIYTLNSITTSKNAISVANAGSYMSSAGINPTSSFPYHDTGFDIYLKSPPESNERKIRVTVGRWGGSQWVDFLDLARERKIVFSKDKVTKDDYYFMETINCDEVKKLRDKVAGIVTKYTKSCTSYDYKNRMQIIVVDSSVHIVDGSTFRRDLSQFVKTDDTINESSSHGPSIYGTMKPDLAGYGVNIISSYSGFNNAGNNHERILFLTGTSMATPMISGTTALIRQYLKEKLNLNSEAVLLKAILIASCDPMNSISSKKRPNSRCGHGIPNLKNVLPLDDSFTFVYAQNVEIQNSQHLVSTIEVTDSSHDLRIALSYYDSATNAEGYHILHCNLNLYVVTPDQKIIYGNHYDNNQSEYYSTNEKVLLHSDEVVKGKYEIHIVSSGDFGERDKYQFSVCASGKIKLENGSKHEISFTKATKCDQCQNNGECSSENQLCQCPEGFTGIHCQVAEEVIEPSLTQSKEFSIEPNELKYFWIKLPNSYTRYTITFEAIGPNEFKHHWIWYDKNPFSLPFDASSVERFASNNNFVQTKSIVFNSDKYPSNTFVHLAFHNNYDGVYKVKVTISHDGSSDPPIVKPTATPEIITTSKSSDKPETITTSKSSDEKVPTIESSNSDSETTISKSSGDIPYHTTNSIGFDINDTTTDGSSDAQNNNQNKNKKMLVGIISGCVAAIVVIIVIIVVAIYIRRRNQMVSSDEKYHVDIQSMNI